MSGKLNRPSGFAIKSITLMLGIFVCGSAPCQLNSNAPAITLNAALAESLSVSASPSSMSFNLVPGGLAAGSTPIAITTSWVLTSSRAAVTLMGSFGSSTVALASTFTPEVDIPTYAVYGLMSSGLPTSFSPFTANTPLGVAASGLPLFTQLLTSGTRNFTRTDNLTLEINLLLLPQLPSGNYTGSLLLQAQAL